MRRHAAHTTIATTAELSASIRPLAMTQMFRVPSGAPRGATGLQMWSPSWGRRGAKLTGGGALTRPGELLNGAGGP